MFTPKGHEGRAEPGGSRPCLRARSLARRVGRFHAAPARIALRDSNARPANGNLMPDAEPFESPLETLSDGVWLLEADGRLAAANRAFAALLDPAAETPARGTSWKDLAELLGRFG